VEADRLRVDSSMVGSGIRPGNGGFRGSGIHSERIDLEIVMGNRRT